MIDCITEFLGAVLILARDFVFPCVGPFPLRAPAEIEFVIYLLSFFFWARAHDLWLTHPHYSLLSCVSTHSFGSL